LSGEDWGVYNLSETEAVAQNRAANFRGPLEIRKPFTFSEKAPVRTFSTGATRDTEDGKLDYDGFLSPLALKRYAEYMHEHRTQPDGTLRPGDNWKKGIPLDAYAKSEWRHHMEFWSLHHGVGDGDIQSSICATIFNLFGYLHELLKEE
jgi:hypothetical protein